MIREKAPPISKELVEHMARLFPDKSPDPRDTNREVWMKAGSVEVVRKLRQLHEAQAKNAL
jgi:hypothetical protein